MGDDPAVALAPGTAFRTAYDEALLEIDAGLASPSPTWRRRFALVLGLQRILSEDKPHLADGLELRAHQVDALAGMLAALLGDAQRNWEDDAAGTAADNGNGNGNGDDDDAPAAAGRRLGRGGTAGAPLTLTLGFELEDDDDGRGRGRADDGRGRRRRHRRGADDDDENGDGRAEPSRSTTRAPCAGTGSSIRPPRARPSPPPGFVDAATITGVLILTHRRLLVEQFKRDLTQHGYGGRIREAILERQARRRPCRRSRSRRTRGSSATPSC